MHIDHLNKFDFHRNKENSEPMLTDPRLHPLIKKSLNEKKEIESSSQNLLIRDDKSARKALFHQVRLNYIKTNCNIKTYANLSSIQIGPTYNGCTNTISRMWYANWIFGCYFTTIICYK